MIFLVIVLLAVGPEKLPTFMRTVGRGVRQVRRAAREFRDATGIDDLLREDPPRPKPRAPENKPVPAEPKEQDPVDETQALDLNDGDEVKPARPSATPPAIPDVAKVRELLGDEEDADAEALADAAALEALAGEEDSQIDFDEEPDAGSDDVPEDDAEEDDVMEAS